MRGAWQGVEILQMARNFRADWRDCIQALREDDRETRQMSWVWHELDVVKGQIQEWIGRFVVIERAVERQQSKQISDAEFARRDPEVRSQSSYLDDTTWADQLRDVDFRWFRK